MSRHYPLRRIAYPLALAVLCMTPAWADVHSGRNAGLDAPGALARLPNGKSSDKIQTADATGRWDWLVDRVNAYLANRAAEAELKRAEAELRRQGGSRLLVKVDTDALREAIPIQLRDDVRRQLREAAIAFGGLAARDGSVEVRIREEKDRQQALIKLTSLSSGDSVDIVDAGEGLIRLVPTEAGFAERVRELRKQSMQVIARRLENFGVAAAGVQPDGLDRIRVLLPGVKDPERLSALFNKRARIAFRLVDDSMTAADALRGTRPPGSEILYELNTRDPFLLVKGVAMEGDDIVDASPGFDQRTRAPIVTFRFNAHGTRRFAQVTEANVGRAFAVVLDNDVLAAPIIREPILGGSGQISGGFTVEDAYTVAMLLRSGTLPGRLVVVEQQVVEPVRED